jgi:hypothetical protein
MLTRFWRLYQNLRHLRYRYPRIVALTRGIDFDRRSSRLVETIHTPLAESVGDQDEGSRRLKVRDHKQDSHSCSGNIVAAKAAALKFQPKNAS